MPTVGDYPVPTTEDVAAWDHRLIRVGMYFAWAGHLWYIHDVRIDVKEQEQVILVENCKTDNIRWMPTRHFISGMREVNPG